MWRGGYFAFTPHIVFIMNRFSTDLGPVLTSRALRMRAGEKSYARGEQYFREDRVQTMIESPQTIRAMVRGSVPYFSGFESDGAHLRCFCSCPMGHKNKFCKHLVAVGLTWLAYAGTLNPLPAKQPQEFSADDLEHWLTHQPRKRLVALLMRRALAFDNDLHDLALEAVLDKRSKLHPSVIRTVLRTALRDSPFENYQDPMALGQRLQQIVTQLRALLTRRNASMILGLVAETLEVCESITRKLVHTHDELEAGLRDLAALHHQACVVARPNAQALAHALFDWEVACERPLFADAARTYAAVLGTRGLVVYRELAATMYAALREHHTTSLEYRRVEHIRATLEKL